MEKIITTLDGYKTYIAAGAGAVSVVAYIFGYITFDQLSALTLLFGFGGLAGIRSALSKLK